ncbi:S-adenosyl-L-methionine-dependent methyltransferase [Hypoxylon sp. FL1857]|nr:S-adenosyl-L-methionine-dependent methyltransferase [Hypoxylon sp. FL1857]
MDAAIARIEELASTADENTPRELRLRLLNVVHSLEDTNDTFHRFAHCHLSSAVVKIGLDLGLFKRLTDSKGIVTLEIIAERTGADISLLGRFMRYLACIGAVDQVSRNQFAANHTTRNLSQKVLESGISHCFEVVAPIYQAMPSFLQETKYVTPTDPVDTAWQRAFNTPMHALEWLSRHPDKLARFGDYMASRDGPSRGWLDVYPVQEELATRDWEEGTTQAVFVNVGVGFGHPCAEFKKKFPHVPGRVVLQDLPPMIEQVPQVPGVENMAHNLFDEQPVKGAKYYFMRAILHNHPDHLAKVLLERVRDAMAPDSVLLLDDYVVSEQWPDFFSRSISDLTMLGTFSSQERFEEQWCSLFGSVGLRLVKSYPLNKPPTSETVMEVRLK